jgi:hypothetical protein
MVIPGSMMLKAPEAEPKRVACPEPTRAAVENRNVIADRWIDSFHALKPPEGVSNRL